MSRWTHGHSTVAGILLALGLERHALAVLLVVFTLGVATGRFWSAGAGLARAALERARRGRRQRLLEREIPF